MSDFSDEVLQFIFEHEDKISEGYKTIINRDVRLAVERKYGQPGILIFDEFMSADPENNGEDPCPECTQKAQQISDSYHAMTHLMIDTIPDELCEEFITLHCQNETLQFSNIMSFLESRGVTFTPTEIKQFKVQIFLKYLLLSD